MSQPKGGDKVKWIVTHDPIPGRRTTAVVCDTEGEAWDVAQWLKDQDVAQFHVQPAVTIGYHYDGSLDLSENT